MKNKNYILGLALVAIVALTFNSCKKKDDDTATPTPTAANGTLFIHLHTDVDTAEVANYDSVNVMSSGRKITVHKAQLYISGIQLIKLDGSTVDVSGVIVLKKQEEEVYSIGSVPSGNYKSVKFNVGLSASTNSSTPAVSDSTLNTPPMWFGATAQPSGFVFVNFQGTIDTTTSATGSVAQMQTFSYKIGTTMNLKSVTMPDQNYTVSPNAAQYIHMMIDYNMLFTGVQLNVSSNLTMNTTSANASSFGMQLANNIPSMFMYE